MTNQNSEDFKLALGASDAYLSSTQNQPLSNSQLATGRVNLDGATTRYSQDKHTEVMKQRIAVCREMYENVGIIGNVVDLMVDFAIEGFTITHSSKPIERFFANWSKKVKLYDVVEQMLKGIYRDGNVPVLTIRGKLDTEEIKAFKSSLATAADKTGDNIIPMAYSFLDILKVNITGSDLLGNVQYEYMIEADVLNSIRDPKTPAEKNHQKLLETQLGTEVYKTLKDGGSIILPADRLSMMYYKKDEYQRWANPMLWRVVDDVKFKKLLRDMDISVAESVCNVLTIIKLGNVKDGFPAPPAKYTKLANMLKNPSKSKIIIWDDLIDIQSEYPPVHQILGSEKYKQVNDDIRSGLGIAEILVNGQGGNYSNSYLSVKTLLERLETGRQHILTWLQEQVKNVSKALGFKKVPIIKMRHMSLTDEAAAKQIILELYDRNILSAQTVLEYMEEDVNVETPRMQDEDAFRFANKDKYPFTLVKTGKFGPLHLSGVVPIGMTANPALPTPASPTTQGPAGDQGGRPTGTGHPQEVDRNTKPVGEGI